MNPNQSKLHTTKRKQPIDKKPETTSYSPSRGRSKTGLLHVSTMFNEKDERENS